MKRLRKVNSATNSVNIPARTDVIEAADDELLMIRLMMQKMISII